MKNLFLLGLLVFFQGVVSARDIFEEIPVTDGKVVFSQTISSQQTKEEIQAKLTTWLNGNFVSENGIINANDSVSGLIVVQKTDFLEIEKKALSIFGMYMKYYLIFECKDNACTIRLKSINYVEMEEANSKKDKKEWSYFPAEMIIVDKKYKVAFVKDAAERIKTKTLERVNELFSLLLEEVNGG